MRQVRTTSQTGELSLSVEEGGGQMSPHARGPSRPRLPGEAAADEDLSQGYSLPSTTTGGLTSGCPEGVKARGTGDLDFTRVKYPKSGP